MWIDCSDDTGAFPNINKMYRSEIEGDTGAQLVMSLNVFSSWILIKYRTVLNGKKKLQWSP